MTPIVPCPTPVHCTPQVGCIIKYALDRNGCSYCYADCSSNAPVVPPAPGPSPRPCAPCRSQCEPGQFLHRDTDMYGCPKCTCRECPEAECPPLPPGGGCRNGIHLLDDNGCRTCQCAEDCEPCLCPYGQMPAGSSYNVSGCPGCTCLPCPVPSCAPPLNGEGCTNGFAYTEHGCQTCECAAGPSPPPSLPRCPLDRFVTSPIPQGAYHIKTGCPAGTAQRTVDTKDICCHVIAANSDKPGIT